MTDEGEGEREKVCRDDMLAHTERMEKGHAKTGMREGVPRVQQMKHSQWKLLLVSETSSGANQAWNRRGHTTARMYAYRLLMT